MSVFVVAGQAGTALSHDGSVPVLSVRAEGADWVVSVDEGQGRRVVTYRLTDDAFRLESTVTADQQFHRGTIGGAALTIASSTFRALEGGQASTVFSRDSGALSSSVVLLPVTSGGNAFVLAAGAEFSGVHSLSVSGRTLISVSSVQDTATTLAAGVTSMAATAVAGRTFVAVASGSEHGVTLYRLDPSGQMIAATSVGATTGVPIATPQVLQFVSTGAGTFLLVGSAGTGSITVFAVSDTGGLQQTDHVLDDRNTRFAGISVMETAVVNGLVYVVAGGADDGLSLFVLLPNGRLIHLNSIEDTTSAGLDNVTGVALAVEGSTLHVFVTSQSEAGVTHLVVTFDPNTRLIAGSGGPDTLTGGAADDILMDGAGSDSVTGGGGADLFVLSADGVVDTIRDFELGVDRVDVSGWPRLYSTAQLTITAIPGGAEIVFGTERLILLTRDGRSLSYSDFIEFDILGIVRIPLLPEVPNPALPLSLIGTPFEDDLRGADANDTIMALDGNDLIYAGAGNDSVVADGGADSVYGGAGRDSLYGGTGADWLYGEDGNDVLEGESSTDHIEGGAGDDLIVGGTGADTLYGGDGADEIYGNTGVDLIYGGAGNDSISSGDGADQIHAGLGNDTVIGRTGVDTIFGGGGDDFLLGSDGVDFLHGEDGADLLYGGFGWDQIFGGAGNDSVYGNIGSDSLEGGAGLDLLLGGSGDDSLYGGDGSDELYGNQGRDWLEGGAGNDILRGGTLQDSFVFRAGSGDDIITDFEVLNDVLRVERALLYTLSPANFLDRYAQVVDGNTVLQFANGDSVTLIGVLDPDDLVARITLI